MRRTAKPWERFGLSRLRARLDDRSHEQPDEPTDDRPDDRDEDELAADPAAVLAQ